MNIRLSMGQSHEVLSAALIHRKRCDAIEIASLSMAYKALPAASAHWSPHNTSKIASQKKGRTHTYVCCASRNDRIQDCCDHNAVFLFGT
jgi:hypothetical protein